MGQRPRDGEKCESKTRMWVFEHHSFRCSPTPSCGRARSRALKGSLFMRFLSPDGGAEFQLLWKANCGKCQWCGVEGRSSPKKGKQVSNPHSFTLGDLETWLCRMHRKGVIGFPLLCSTQFIAWRLKCHFIVQIRCLKCKYSTRVL